eukprot:TRINITY_DN43_c0_g2_i7.p1 TRINITY_DN43_c0_g2~~TRINITY_DN43_c0_g2_i7.p1  ORF type:complete len:340 (+),score=91.61 TRINITY_DN43_c0_g2_i7:18-1037(+)
MKQAVVSTQSTTSVVNNEASSGINAEYFFFFFFFFFFFCIQAEQLPPDGEVIRFSNIRWWLSKYQLVNKMLTSVHSHILVRAPPYTGKSILCAQVAIQARFMNSTVSTMSFSAWTKDETRPINRFVDDCVASQLGIARIELFQGEILLIDEGQVAYNYTAFWNNLKDLRSTVVIVFASYSQTGLGIEKQRASATIPATPMVFNAEYGLSDLCFDSKTITKFCSTTLGCPTLPKYFVDAMIEATHGHPGLLAIAAQFVHQSVGDQQVVPVVPRIPDASQLKKLLQGRPFYEAVVRSRAFFPILEALDKVPGTQKFLSAVVDEPRSFHIPAGVEEQLSFFF